MERIKQEIEWYNQVQIELRAKNSKQKFYQVMRLHPREIETCWLTFEQAKNYCDKHKLTVVNNKER